MQAPSGNQGRIAENIMYFARLLRSAGLPVGPGKVLDAITVSYTHLTLPTNREV